MTQHQPVVPASCTVGVCFSKTLGWHQAGSSRDERQKVRERAVSPWRAGKDRALALWDEGERHEWSFSALGRGKRNTCVNVSSMAALSEEQLESLGESH